MFIPSGDGFEYVNAISLEPGDNTGGYYCKRSRPTLPFINIGENDFKPHPAIDDILMVWSHIDSRKLTYEEEEERTMEESEWLWSKEHQCEYRQYLNEDGEWDCEYRAP